MFQYFTISSFKEFVIKLNEIVYFIHLMFYSTAKNNVVQMLCSYNLPHQTMHIYFKKSFYIHLCVVPPVDLPE